MRQAEADDAPATLLAHVALRLPRTPVGAYSSTFVEYLAYALNKRLISGLHTL